MAPPLGEVSPEEPVEFLHPFPDSGVTGAECPHLVFPVIRLVRMGVHIVEQHLFVAVETHPVTFAAVAEEVKGLFTSSALRDAENPQPVAHQLRVR
jgi:hypothetical protein